jgi:uncharacterized Zn-finger protein
MSEMDFQNRHPHIFLGIGSSGFRAEDYYNL